MQKRELLDLVQYLRATGYLKSEKVANAMVQVDRLFFVLPGDSGIVYSDNALPVGYGQTISAPSVVAFMLEKLEIKEGMKVLEVGTGSGYNCALLAELVGSKGVVVSMDVVAELISQAESNIKKTGRNYQNISLVNGDGSLGYPEKAPYDRIIVTAGMPWFDQSHPLANQLKPDGKLIAPVGGRFFQDLILFDKKTGKTEPVLSVMFVPLIGKFGFKKE